MKRVAFCNRLTEAERAALRANPTNNLDPASAINRFCLNCGKRIPTARTRAKFCRRNCGVQFRKKVLAQ